MFDISPNSRKAALWKIKKYLKQLHRGGTPYFRFKGMIVVFLGVGIGDLIFFRGCSSEIYIKK